MSNYANTKATIDANVYTNGNNEVTAAMVNAAIDAVVDTIIAGGFLYKGIAHPADAAVTPDANCFWIATEAGTYTNKNGYVLDGTEAVIIKYNGSWSKENTGIKLVSVSQNSQTGDESLLAGSTEIGRFADAGKIIKLEGYNIGLDAATAVGQYIHSSYYNKILRCISISSPMSIHDFVEVPFFDGAIYSYNGDLYNWNGTTFVLKTPNITVEQNASTGHTDIKKQGETIGSVPSLNDLENTNSATDRVEGVLDEVCLNVGVPITVEDIVGLVTKTGAINKNLSQFHTLISKKIPVNEGDIFKFKGQNIEDFPAIFLYTDNTIVSTLYDNLNYITVQIPSGINYIRFSSYANAGSPVVYDLEQIKPEPIPSQLTKLQPKRESIGYELLTPVITEGAGLYDCLTGNIDFSTSDEYCYNKYDVENMSAIKVKGRGYTYVNGYSLVTFTDSNNNILGYLHQDVNETIINVPVGCKYAYVNGGVIDAYKPSAYNQIVSYSDLIPEIDSLNKKVNNLIICTGDSVTEGMNMDGGGYAEYGKAPFPAQLYTMLVDNGFDFKVINQGQGGETAPTMVARTGGMACRTHHDVNLPQDTSWVDFGNTVTAESCNMQIPVKKLDGVTDFGVYFTVLKPVTQPLFIDGNLYDCNVISQNSNFYLQIRKQSADNKATKIPAGTIVLTHSSKNPYLNIVFGGYNGRRELNFEKWSTMMESCLTTSANKGFIIGCHIAIWEEWSDITGSTADEKYADYKKKCYDKFGFRFIDLYDLWFRHALDYCLDAGYFSDKTQVELDAMAAKLADHIVPAEFSYDGAHEGNVHLNREGYYAIAKLLYDRLIAIGYIS